MKTPFRYDFVGSFLRPQRLKDARKEMNYLTGDAEVKRLAELREKWEMDRKNAISYATKVGKEERRKKQKYRNSKKTIKNRNDN